MGNQFFRYAFARALQIKFYPDYDLVLNTAAFRNASPQQITEGFENSLKYFRIKCAGYSEKRLRYSMSLVHFCIVAARDRIFRKILPRKILKRIDTMLQPMFNKLGLYNPVSVSAFIEPVKSCSQQILCNANFENAEYFNDIRDILLEEFTPIAGPLPQNAELLHSIQNSESVCVTIRRGDFLSPKNAPHFNVCNEEYFITAMKAIREELPECKFFIFSDDVEDVKRTMHFPFEAEYEAGNDPVWEKLRLMYSCKHFIISNSTFSWWAQYLSRNENKIVYAPTPWHWTGEKWEGLYLPYMRTIECHKV